MKLKLLTVTARNAVIEIEDGGTYYTQKNYEVCINGTAAFQTNRVINAVSGLKPDTVYFIEVSNKDTDYGDLTFTTEHEFVTLDVKAFGAKGNGRQDDTLPIQAAIMACPAEGRVLLSKGEYLVTSLFLKSNLKIEIAEDAVLIAETDRYRYPVLPGLIESYDETGEYNLGTWEGNPLPMFSGVLNGIGVENIYLYGEGTIDGRAAESDWWQNEKVMRGAFRPRLLFLSNCGNVTVQGLHFKNSPAWAIHPYFSRDLKFLGITVENPLISPNTDGLNPESCRNVTIEGCRFSLGDDCIALKSGKIYMGKKYKVPCENIIIEHCLMENGHGAITAGSEMAAGILNICVRDCIFQSTDRGLRIKTRRGRGKDAVIDNIVFDHILMKDVKTPIVVNCFYCCDPDGKTEYVQSKKEFPVDDRTPKIKTLMFSNITCENCHAAAAYIYGLPEQKIEQVHMENITFTYSGSAQADVPAMMCGIKPCAKLGIFAANVSRLVLRDVSINGQAGEKYTLLDIDSLEK